MQKSYSPICFVLGLLLDAISPALVGACDSPACTCDKLPPIVLSSQRGCWVATSANFQVCSLRNSNEAESVAEHCEKLRSSLAAAYGLKIEQASWHPKCQIFLHVDANKYGAIVGKEFMQTLGSSLVKPETGEVASRRIDLRTDVPNYLQEVLPHELSHVLIADLFRACAPPLWYDEGLALLTDSQSKQALHQRNLRTGMKRGREFTLSELLTATEYPPADRVGVFYGQCASLARCLCREGSPEKIHQFAERSKEIGVNLALKECYGIAGLPALEQAWRKSINQPVRQLVALDLPAKSSGSFSQTSFAGE